MRFTEFHRTAFVGAALQDVPTVDYDEKIRTLATQEVLKALPPKVRAIWSDPDVRGFLKTQTVFIGNASVEVPGSYDDSRVVKARLNSLPSLVTLVAASEEQTKKHRSLKASLTAVAKSVTTRKALADALPEFEKYLPAAGEPINRSVPAIANVVRDFTEAGWPKGGKKQKGKQ